MTVGIVKIGLSKLATSEILTGTFLYVGDNRFSEQNIYSFFKQLESESPELSGRFGVFGSGHNLQSYPLRQALSFLEIGKVLELPPPEPVIQFYKISVIGKDSIRKNLEERGVLPFYEPLF